MTIGDSYLLLMDFIAYLSLLLFVRSVRRGTLLQVESVSALVAVPACAILLILASYALQQPEMRLPP